MSYPVINNSTFLRPVPAGNTNSSSGSPSSVDPVTPDLPDTKMFNGGRRDSNVSNQSGGEDSIPCKWAGCDHFAEGAEELYDHLCQVHVGRKSTGNLCLTCGWEGCDVKCVKRDHITSHLRVHTPLKPHPCAVCGKTFKRPQDLKKHERIHTQEHHQLHKLSKAATAADPTFGAAGGRDDRRADRQRSPLSQSLSPSSSAQSHVIPSSPFEHMLHPMNPHPSHKSVSPTPSALAALHKKQHEELAAYQHREMLVLQQLALQQQQSQVYAAQLTTESLDKGAKRGQDDAFGVLWEDMKRRKVEPVYDSNMINRLNGIMPPSLPVSYPSISSLPALPSLPTNGGYSSQGMGGSGSTFNNNHFNPIPQQTFHDNAPFPLPQINSEQDLAMFNQFMISLGREAAGAPSHNMPPFSMNHATSFDSSALSTGSGSSPSSDQSPIEDLFNPEELASLGLGGMPGIPTSTSAPASFQFGGMYPSLDTNRSRAASTPDVFDPSKRAIAGLPRGGSMQSMPKFDFNHQQTHNSYPELLDFSSDFSFDSLARSKQAPQATLAPRDFHKKTYRHVAQLGAAVSSRSSMARESAERTAYEDDDDRESDDLDIPTPKIPLAALLDDDGPVTLPAIDHPDAEDGEDRPTLPSIHSTLPELGGLHRPPVKRHTEDDILRGVKRLELRDGASAPSPAPEDRPTSIPRRETPRDTRRRHAAMIRAWLVAVNLQYRRQKLSVEMGESMSEDEDE